MKKLKVIFQRILQILPVLIGISIVTFLLAQVMPGDPIRLLLGPRASAEAIEVVRRQYGLDQPILSQYFIYLRNLIQGDWGRSLSFKMPVLDLIADRSITTIYLMLGGLIFSAVPAVILSVVAANNQDKWLDQVIRFSYTFGLGLPSFWLAIIAILIFAVNLGWFPATGFGVSFSDRVYHLVLPSLAIGIAVSPILIRNLRATLLEKKEADFVTAGRAKGIPENSIFQRHVFPNSIIPSLHLFGVVLVYLLGYCVVIEPIFALPGLGNLFIRSIIGRDYFVVQGLTLVFAIYTILSSLMVDIISMMIDPRIEP